jgi:hypothetical protein
LTGISWPGVEFIPEKTSCFLVQNSNRHFKGHNYTKHVFFWGCTRSPQKKFSGNNAGLCRFMPGHTISKLHYFDGD